MNVFGEPYYLLSHGKLGRKGNTLIFIKKDGNKTKIPIEMTSEIFAIGRVTLTSGAISLLSKYGIPVHFFGKSSYKGSFLPRNKNISGFILVKQVENYLDKEKRLYLARKFLEGARDNYYNFFRRELEEESRIIKNIEFDGDSVEILMGIEGYMMEIAYKGLGKIVGINFEARTRRPPRDPLNALISFVNSLLYSEILTQIYFSHLDPTISYLHEPFERRFSLSLDLAEVFRPLIVFPVIRRIFNIRKLSEEDFLFEKGVFLRERGKRIVLEEFEKRLRETFIDKKLKRKISYRTAIRLECYKLEKHLIGEKPYQPITR